MPRNAQARERLRTGGRGLNSERRARLAYHALMVDSTPSTRPASRRAGRGSRAAAESGPSIASPTGGAPGAYPKAVDRLIEAFAALPGIGRRSAERLAFHLLKSGPEEAEILAQAVLDVKRTVRHCRYCWHLTDVLPGVGASGGAEPGPECALCADSRRDRALVMVVEQPRDLLALEKTGLFRGVYHVLMGRMSPLEGVGEGELTIASLLARVADAAKNPGEVTPREVILGLNPTLEGDGTALHLARELSERGVRVSRLARGLPSGTSLEFANKAVLADAIEGRRPMSS